MRIIADLSQSINAVRKLYFNADLREALGRNGNTYVRQFDTHTIGQLWNKVFHLVYNETGVPK